MSIRRVAIVSPYDVTVPGGVQTHVLGLGQALASAYGAEVVVLSPGRPGAVRRADLTVVGLGATVKVPYNGSVAPVSLDPRVVTRLRSHLRGWRPDVLHVHEPLAPLAGLAASLFGAGTVPSVASLHMSSERALAYRLYGRLLRRALARYEHVVAVGRDTAAFQGRVLGLDPDGIPILPNAVHFPDPPPAVARQAGRIVFVGRLDPRKGCQVLLEAIARLPASVSDGIPDVIVLGDGPLRPRLEQQAGRLRVPVTFRGRADDAAKWEVLYSSSVLVAPALGGEAFGIVITEGMAAGCAVVASDIDGYRLASTHGVDALAVPPGDPDRLAQALTQLIENPDLRDRLVAGAAETARAYSWETVAPRVLDLYRSAVERRVSRP